MFGLNKDMFNLFYLCFFGWYLCLIYLICNGYMLKLVLYEKILESFEAYYMFVLVIVIIDLKLFL